MALVHSLEVETVLLERIQEFRDEYRRPLT